MQTKVMPGDAGCDTWRQAATVYAFALPLALAPHHDVPGMGYVGPKAPQPD